MSLLKEYCIPLLALIQVWASMLQILYFLDWNELLLCLAVEVEESFLGSKEQPKIMVLPCHSNLTLT